MSIKSNCIKIYPQSSIERISSNFLTKFIIYYNIIPKWFFGYLLWILDHLIINIDTYCNFCLSSSCLSFLLFPSSGSSTFFFFEGDSLLVEVLGESFRDGDGEPLEDPDGDGDGIFLLCGEADLCLLGDVII